MLRDSDYPTELQPFLPSVRSLSGRLSDGDDDDRADIAQEMFRKILEVRAKKPDASDAYLRSAAWRRGVEFALRELHDGPIDRKLKRVDRSRLSPYDEDEIAHHSHATVSGKTKAQHTARKRRSWKWS